MKRRRLIYLCLQTAREGRASYAHVHEIIAGLERRGWEVTLWEPGHEYSSGTSGLFRRLFEFVRLQVRLWRQADSPLAIYIRNHFAALPTACWAKLRSIPVVQEVNGPYEDLFMAWPLTRRFAFVFIWLTRTQLRMADAVIAVTPQLADWARAETKGRCAIHVVPNGVNTQLFHPRAQTNLDLPGPYVVFFGWFAPWQGITTLLEAVRLGTWPQNLTLVIVGDGEGREEVEVAARESSRVRYLRQVAYRDLPGIVAGSLAGLIPKKHEKAGTTGLLPLKLFETLACGVPVVVTDFPGMADLVRQHRCGIVIEPDQPTAVVKAAAYLLEHREEAAKMGIRGRTAVSEHHSWDARAEATDKVLRSIQ